MIKILLSVIVPVYNSEKYIKKCLESLLNQKTDYDYEIIVINDGSTDNSLEIIKKISEKNPELYIVDTKNGGVSSARNKGLEIAKGDYITFCDSDDWIDNDTFDNLIETMLNYKPELVVYGRKDILNNSEEFFYQNHFKIKELFNQNQEYMENFFFKGKHTFSVCNKLYKKNIISENNIKFSEELILSEDTFFNLEYLRHVKHIVEDFRSSYNRLYRTDSTITVPIIDFYLKNKIIIKKYESKFQLNNEETLKLFSSLIFFYGKVSSFRVINGIDITKNNPKYEILRKIFRDKDFTEALKRIEYKDYSFRDQIYIFCSKNNLYRIFYFIFKYVYGIGRIIKRIFRKKE